MLNDLFAETWKELKCGANEDNHPFNVGCLATFESAEFIKQRMVNLRKVTTEHHLFFYTDIRSSKIAQIEKNPSASVLFYNDSIKLQVFLKGSIIIHTDNELWEDHKHKIEGKSINDYNSKYAPGKKINNPINITRTEDLNFALLEFIPRSIEYLKLRAQPNRLRALFTQKEPDWDKTFLIP